MVMSNTSYAFLTSCEKCTILLPVAYVIPTKRGRDDHYIIRFLQNTVIDGNGSQGWPDFIQNGAFLISPVPPNGNGADYFLAPSSAGEALTLVVIVADAQSAVAAGVDDLIDALAVERDDFSVPAFDIRAGDERDAFAEGLARPLKDLSRFVV